MTTIRQAIEEKRDKLIKDLQRVCAKITKLADEAEKIPDAVKDLDVDCEFRISVYPHHVTIIVEGEGWAAFQQLFDACPQAYNIIGDPIEEVDECQYTTFSEKEFYVYPKPEEGDMVAVSISARQRKYP